MVHRRKCRPGPGLRGDQAVCHLAVQAAVCTWQREGSGHLRVCISGPRPAASHHAGLPGGRRLSLTDLCSVSSAGSCWKSHVCNTAGVTTDQRQLAPLIFYSGQRLPFPHNHKWKISQGLPVTVIRDVGVSIAVTVPRTLKSSGVMVTAKGSSSQLYLLPSALEAINERDLSNC